MSNNIVGSWKLVTWRRIAEDETVSYPFGEQPQGILIYAPDGTMAVQMLTSNRPKLQTTDALGGTVEERAAAYSTCLAYFGEYQVVDGEVIHRVDGSLFPNWTDTEQQRPFTLDGDQLTLRTPMTHGATEQYDE